VLCLLHIDEKTKFKSMKRRSWIAVDSGGKSWSPADRKAECHKAWREREREMYLEEGLERLLGVFVQNPH
jgi:hypothetical protein